MGLPRTAWLQAVAQVLREASGGGARCVWLLETPLPAGIQYTGGQGPTSGAAPAAHLGKGAPQGLLGTSVRPQRGPSWG